MTPRKYSKNELIQNRRHYLESRTGDLTSYASLLGQTFATRINLLAQLIRDAHHPSLGLYKERLLMSIISQFVPKRYDVGTGFVIFPTARQFLNGVPEAYDVLNSADHVVSRQCDIIVFDANEFPVIFRDGDFVVVRPEAVRAIVEVKGSLRPKVIDEFMEHFIDFGRKWKNCRTFYREKHQPTKLGEPGLFVMIWQVAVDGRGIPTSDGTRLRKRIGDIYKRKLSREELHKFPILDAAYIYADSAVAGTYCLLKNDIPCFGFSTSGGRFVRFDDNGAPIEAGDRTVASLLAGIHYSLEVPFNRFFSYAQQTNRTDLFPHPHQGFTPWLVADEIELLGGKDKD
jgi:hypothetical protein